MISSPACTAHVGYAFTLPIAPSRHRSRRIWKKLAKRRRLSARPIVEPTAYMTPHGLIAHPRIVAELMAERGL